MNIHKKYLVFFLLFLGFTLPPVFCRSADAPKYNPVKSSEAGPLSAEFNGVNVEKIFYLPRYNAVLGVESVNKNWQKIDILAPQMHVVDYDFKIIGGFGPKLKKAIKTHSLRVMPLIANSNFSQTLIHNLLLSESAQNKVIAGLIKLAQEEKYIGWQFDFEHINFQDKDLYTALVKKAYKSFHDHNLTLSVMLVSRLNDYEDTDAFKNWSGAYDFTALAEDSDFVSLMAYDDPNSLGPVASIGFVNNSLSYALKYIPVEKISLGIPLYYWKWIVADAKKVGSGFYKNILLIEDNYRYTTGFDQSLGVSWIDYFYKNKEYKIWFEDKQSFDKKIDIVKNNNLRGFSAWLLGGEDPKIWDSL